MAGRQPLPLLAKHSGAKEPTLPRPPGRCRTLPGKLAVRGLPEAKRRDAKAAGRRALDSELSRRQHAWRGRTARRLRQARSLGACVTAGGRAGGGCGVTARRQRRAPCVPTLRQRARLPPPDGEIPATSAAHGAGPPESSNAVPQVSPRPPHEPARAGRPGAPKACHLSRRETCHRSVAAAPEVDVLTTGDRFALAI